MKKKILFIVGATNIFGAEIVSMSVMDGLKDDFDILCVISGWNDGNFKSRLEANGIKYHEVKLGWYYMSKPLWSLDSLFHYPKAFYEYYDLIRNFNPDIVYVVSYRNLVLLFPLIRRKVIYHVHDQNSLSKQHAFFLRLIDSKVTKYIAVSHCVKDDLARCGIGRDKIVVIHNGVELPDESKLHEYVPDVLRIGIVGQVIPRKGHDVLVRALRLLNAKGYVFRCVVYGSGDEGYINKLKEDIERFSLTDKISWLGYARNGDDIYSNIDLLVVPTLTSEPFGMVCIEAHSYGVPVVASRLGGLKEIVADGVTGFLFKAGDEKELASRIESFIENRELLLKFGKQAKASVEANFQVGKAVTRIKEMAELI